MFGPLREVARGLLANYWRLILSFSLRKKTGREPALLYAGTASGDRARTGGAVKLRQLAPEFPEGKYRGNILYLVTSSLPPAAVTWAAAARRKGIKFILNQNGVAFPAWASPAEMKRINERNARLLALADHVIFQSEFCRRSCEHWVGKPVGTSSIIHNPVDVESFCPIDSERKPDFDLLVMGSHAQRERVFLPLLIVKRAKDRGLSWRLKVAGRLLWPDAECEVRAFLTENQIADRVELHGGYSQAEAPRIYQNTELLLHLQDKDASPTVPLEAMACGIPVIGLRSGGMPELVPNGMGELLPVAESWTQYHYPDPEALFSVVDRRLKGDRVPIGNLREHVAKNFSALSFREAHRQLFHDILSPA
jgi:glycosyltransferase involved in cell wall biosynthesis